MTDVLPFSFSSNILNQTERVVRFVLLWRRASFLLRYAHINSHTGAFSCTYNKYNGLRVIKLQRRGSEARPAKSSSYPHTADVPEGTGTTPMIKAACSQQQTLPSDLPHEPNLPVIFQSRKHLMLKATRKHPWHIPEG